MNKDITEFYDLVALVAILIMSLTGITLLASEWWDTGITSIRDKSISYSMIEDSADNYTGEDICAMLCKVDYNTAEPRAIKLDFHDEIIYFTDAWIRNKEKEVLKIMNEYGLKDKLSSKVTSIKYVEEADTAYYLITFN